MVVILVVFCCYIPFGFEINKNGNKVKYTSPATK